MNEEGSYYVDEEAGELVLKNEGVEERFVIEDEVRFDGSKYLVLIPADNDESQEALVLKMVQDGDQSFLSIIEDEEEFQNVRERYLSK
ncbi:MAG TPA: DUF1292 domain-containing protein [Halanaerobiales bacterium]|nr:DUF1292 domain-containing protein [Halanaerobiales bacterium]